MRKQILAIAAVMVVIIVLIFIRIEGSNDASRYDGNIPYVPPAPSSILVDSRADPNVPFGEIAARMVFPLPVGAASVLWWQNTEYEEYIALLEQHGWQLLNNGTFNIIQSNCHYKKLTHEDTVRGPGWTLSVSEERMKDGSGRIEALVTRGYKTGPQSCGDL